MERYIRVYLNGLRNTSLENADGKCLQIRFFKICQKYVFGFDTKQGIVNNALFCQNAQNVFRFEKSPN